MAAPYLDIVENALWNFINLKFLTKNQKIENNGTCRIYLDYSAIEMCAFGPQ